ncbi:CDC42 small effector protein 2-like [Oscarella lobularis]|uniref:CDC42 small effector protein 2-like n=1 Tax=Oscarella lobularis TaxID=121494 RepID=UPI003313A8D8
MSQSWLCPSCFRAQEPPPRRRKIDRTMIGLPQNFQHTGHIGSGDMSTQANLNSIQTQMESKGGYGESQQIPDSVTPDGIPVRHESDEEDPTPNTT